MMEVVKIILTVFEVIASLALIVVVMMQSGKEAGLGAIAGNSDSYMSKNGKGGCACGCEHCIKQCSIKNIDKETKE